MRRTIITSLVLIGAIGLIFYLKAGPGANTAAGGGTEKGATKGPAKGPGGPGEHGAPPPPEVGFIDAQPTSVTLFYEYVGTTEASKKIEIRARIQGFLKQRAFEEGALVKQGDLLYEIDPRQFSADLEIGRAQVAEADSRMKLAERETERLRSLKDSKVISESEFDKQSAELDAAKAALSLAKAQLAKAQLELSYTKISAPITGLIEKTFKEVGSLVDEGTNSLLTEILQVDPMYVVFQLSESEFLALQSEVQKGTIRAKPGVEPWIEITLINGAVYPEKGTINFQDPSIDAQMGTVRYRAHIPNPEGKLRPGQFVKVHPMGWERPASIVVPQGAVNQSPAGAYVYVVGPDNKAEKRMVTLGDWSGDNWIVKEGLKAGDHVIVDGVAKVQPGIVVAAKPLEGKSAKEKMTASKPAAAEGK